jgi:hypothetical protein
MNSLKGVHGIKPQTGERRFFSNNLESQIKYVIISEGLVRRIFTAYFGGQYLTSMNIRPRKVDGSNGYSLRGPRKLLLVVKGVRSVTHCLEVQM